jgi:hypothetical protein
MPDLTQLLAALDRDDSETKVTSVRRPRALDEALQTAVALGWASSANEGGNRALRISLEAFALGAALDAHLEAHPELEPGIADVAIAVAELRHDPLADTPEFIRSAAEEILGVKADASADDVLVWALSMLTHGVGQAKPAKPRRRPLVDA